MSDYIHVELQTQIIKRLPVKSLIKFRTVSKQWKSLIDSFDFMVAYTRHQQKHQPLLLIGYQGQEYVSLSDDDIFHKHTTTPSPISVQLNVENTYLVGVSLGLLCFVVYDHQQQQHGDDHDTDSDSDNDINKDDDDYYYDNYYEEDEDYSERVTAVIWNPSIRKSVTIKVPKKYNLAYGGVVYGFGVLPITFDPIILKIARTTKLGERVDYGYWRIYVFTLSSGAWKSVRGALPDDSIEFTDSHAAVNGFIYWRAYKAIKSSTWYDFYKINVIVSFNLTSHDFRVIYLPTSLSKHGLSNMSVSKLRESLVVLKLDEQVSKSQGCTVWMMVDNDGSFTKLYTIQPADTSVKKVLGFTNRGAPIIEMKNDDDGDSSTIGVYDTESQHMSAIGIYEVNRSFSVSPCIETLLLLNHPDSMED